jgi:hypothetical protein
MSQTQTIEEACEELLTAWDNACNDRRDAISFESLELATAIEGIRAINRPEEYKARIESLGEESK